MALPRRVLLALLAVAVLFAGGCGGDDDESAGDAPAEPTTTTTEAPEIFTPPFEGEAAEIAGSFEQFFGADTSPEVAATLIEQAPQTEAILQAAAAAAGDQETTVEVTQIARTGDADSATVTFTLNVGATPIEGAIGFAVLQDGSWKVSLSTLCSLLSLAEGGPPAECEAVSSPA